MGEYICRSCSHIFEVDDSQACPYCGSENTGMAGGVTPVKYVPNSRALQPEKDVYNQTHAGITFRLAYGFRLLKKAGDS